MDSVRLPTISRTVERPVWLDEQPRDFNHNSLNRADYVRHNLSRMPKLPDLRTTIGAYTSTLPLMDHITEYREKYRIIPTIKKRRRIKRELLGMSSEPLASVSNYRNDFIEKGVVVTENFKPSEIASLSDEPFNATSVYKNDFPVPPADCQKDRRLLEDMKESDVQVARPKERTLIGVTEHSGNFLVPGPNPRVYYPPGYNPPTIPFGNETSYGSCFVRYNQPPAKSIRRPDKAFTSDQPFDGVSLYKDSYIPKPIRKNSANILENKSGMLTYCHNDDPEDPRVPTEDFPENLGSVLFHT